MISTAVLHPYDIGYQTASVKRSWSAKDERTNGSPTHAGVGIYTGPNLEDVAHQTWHTEKLAKEFQIRKIPS
jgi:hypothetical protein